MLKFWSERIVASPYIKTIKPVTPALYSNRGTRDELRIACVALFSITIAQPAWADIELEDNMPVEQWSN